TKENDVFDFVTTEPKPVLIRAAGRVLRRHVGAADLRTEQTGMRSILLSRRPGPTETRPAARCHRNAAYPPRMHGRPHAAPQRIPPRSCAKPRHTAPHAHNGR